MSVSGQMTCEFINHFYLSLIVKSCILSDLRNNGAVSGLLTYLLHLF